MYFFFILPHTVLFLLSLQVGFFLSVPSLLDDQRANFLVSEEVALWFDADVFEIVPFPSGWADCWSMPRSVW